MMAPDWPSIHLLGNLGWGAWAALSPHHQPPLPPMSHRYMRLVSGVQALWQGCSIGPTRIWLLAFKANKYPQHGANPHVNSSEITKTAAQREAACTQMANPEQAPASYCFPLIFQYAAYDLIYCHCPSHATNTEILMSSSAFL